jgi:hypothetical protein
MSNSKNISTCFEEEQTRQVKNQPMSSIGSGSTLHTGFYKKGLQSRSATASLLTLPFQVLILKQLW